MSSILVIIIVFVKFIMIPKILQQARHRNFKLLALLTKNKIYLNLIREREKMKDLHIDIGISLP